MGSRFNAADEAPIKRQRAERHGLIVQNHRFLVLAQTRMPNLASRAMGIALRNLPGQWQEKHGYLPLFAETFTDIESFEGTCYKASNWQPCGLTKDSSAWFCLPDAKTSPPSTATASSSLSSNAPSSTSCPSSGVPPAAAPPATKPSTTSSGS